MDSRIKLIVGLGNPGSQYAQTRHNAGAWLIERLARQQGIQMRANDKFFGLANKATVDGHDVWLLIPTTYMNRSGQAVAALANFYKISTEQILVAHDELDLQPGSVKLKIGGGHGGHNGLRDTISRLENTKNFIRLRIGIGHPGHRSLVHNYVLGRAHPAEQDLIDQAIGHTLNILPTIIQGQLQTAMSQLNGFNAS